MKKLLWLLILIPTLCYGAAGDVASIGGKAVTAVSTVMGVAGASVATMAGKNYTDGDVAGNSDTFDRSNGGLGSPWEVASSALTNLAISSNVATSAGEWAAGSGMYGSSSADISQAVLKGNSPTAAAKGGVCVRMSTGHNGYCFYLGDISAGNYTTWEILQDGEWLCNAGSISYAINADHVLKITASGTSTVTISAYVGGDTITTTCSDAVGALESGSPGIWIAPNGAPNPQFDDWQDY